MNAMLLEVLQNANAIEILTKLLDEQGTGRYITVSTVATDALRRAHGACAGNLEPHLPDAVQPLPSAGKSCRKLLWQQDGLSLYMRLLVEDPYFQVSALEAILNWCVASPGLGVAS
jgi:hypothetical protein